MIDGQIGSATIEEGMFTVGGVPFAHARLTLDDVTFQTSKLLLHHRGPIRAASGDGVLDMTGPDLARAFQAHGVDVSISVGGGEIRASGGSLPQEIAVAASVDQGSLVVQSTEGTPVAFRLPLPSLGSGITYGSVAVRGDQAELTLKVEHALLTGLVG